MFNNFRTTDNKKVPSFGSSSESQTEPESEDASSSASAATPIDETEKDDKNQPDSTSSTDEVEDTFLRRLISALCSGDQQESVSDEMSDETESEDVQEGETTESVSQETALVRNIMEEDTFFSGKKFMRSFKSTFMVPFYIRKEKLQRGLSSEAP